MSRFTTRLCLSLYCAVGAMAAVQAGDTKPVEQSADIAAYTPEFFTASQPVSAFDMIILLPGFQLREGDSDVRGYSGGAGNVLIDGQRPASKQDSLEAILKRIPAKSVERIELIRSAATGTDMQGHSLIANIVRLKQSAMNGRIEGEYANFQHGFDAPRIAGELSYGKGDSKLDLSAAYYREIDDEHGFGSRNRYAPNGAILRKADYEQPEGTTIAQLSGNYRQKLGGGDIQINGLFKDSRMFADIANRISFPSTRTILGAERKHTQSTEAGLHYERTVGANSSIELLAIRRDEREDASESATEAANSELSLESYKAHETILRGVFRHSGTIALETGIEGALNVLDSHSGLQENGVDILLPAANVRVAEDRAEGFVTATWKPTATLSIETGMRAEISRLTQSGDTNLEKSLFFLKPRLLVTWSPDASNQLHMLVEREVGQLDFGDFVSSTSLATGSTTAGNRDLEPDTLWRAELAWERHIGKGALVLTARHEVVSNVIDHIPVFDGADVFDAVGNIGNGTRDELEADLTMPLDAIGLRGFRVQANGTLRRSRVTDPATGERRNISKDTPAEGKISLTQDLPQLRLRWGINYAIGQSEDQYKIDEVEVETIGERVDIFAEYRIDSAWTVRLFGKNLTNSPVIRSRQLFDGLRGTAPLDYVDERVLRSGPYFGINIQRSFGK